MGIESLHATFLSYCSLNGVDFDTTAMLGRQSLSLGERDLRNVFDKLKISYSQSKMQDIFANTSLQDLKVGFAEQFFQAIGARDVKSIDASAYEGADIIHDMNLAVPEALTDRFSVLFDGGSLEHIFNFPVAIENCMRMVKKGGHFISIGPANNFFGHGFYQFSPELFYRVFCEENGFKIKNVFVCAAKNTGTWYKVPDPASLRRRIAFSNQVPTLQLFVAEKIDFDAGLHVMPQQSDYDDILWKDAPNESWTAHGDSRDDAKLAFNRRMAGLLPRRIADYIRTMRPLIMSAVSPPFKNADLQKTKII